MRKIILGTLAAIAVAAPLALSAAPANAATAPGCETTTTFTAWEPASYEHQFDTVWRHDYTVTIHANGTFEGVGVENGMGDGWTDAWGESHVNSQEKITGTLNDLNITYTAVRADGRTWVLDDVATSPGITDPHLGTTVLTTNTPVIDFRITTPQYKCEPTGDPAVKGVWFNYTGKYAGTTPVPPMNDPKWKASPATPGGEHDFALRGLDHPYQTGNTAKGNGNWFVWKDLS